MIDDTFYGADSVGRESQNWTGKKVSFVDDQGERRVEEVLTDTGSMVYTESGCHQKDEVWLQ